MQIRFGIQVLKTETLTDSYRKGSFKEPPRNFDSFLIQGLFLNYHFSLILFFFRWKNFNSKYYATRKTHKIQLKFHSDTLNRLVFFEIFILLFLATKEIFTACAVRIAI